MNGDNVKKGTDARKDTALAHHDAAHNAAAGAPKVAPPVDIHLAYGRDLFHVFGDLY